MKKRRVQDKKLVALFIKDLGKLEKAWEDLLTKRKKPSDIYFLKEMAEDIKQLKKDTTTAEEKKQLVHQAHIIHHLLTTPWGAPFVCERTLLEAAESYDLQEPLRSDLCHMMDEFTHYSSIAHNQFLTILHAINESLHRETIG